MRVLACAVEYHVEVARRRISGNDGQAEGGQFSDQFGICGYLRVGSDRQLRTSGQQRNVLGEGIAKHRREVDDSDSLKRATRRPAGVLIGQAHVFVRAISIADDLLQTCGQSVTPLSVQGVIELTQALVDSDRNGVRKIETAARTAHWNPQLTLGVDGS